MRPALRPNALDAVLAAALTLATQVEIWAPEPVPGMDEVTGSRPLLAITTLFMTVPLALRRGLPVPVLTAGLAAAAIQQIASTPTEGLSTLIALLVAAYSAGAYPPRRQAAVGGLLVVLGSGLIGNDGSDHLFVAIVLGAAWLMGFIVGQRSEQVERLTLDNRELAARLAEAATLLAEAEAHPASDAAGGLAGLSAREVDVARAIAAGMSNAEIAAHLVISEWTVKTHVASILRKLGLRDRAQVVVAAYESGLVRPGEIARDDGRRGP